MANDGKKRILLIDDDASLLITLSDFLKFEGYDVTTADSGEQGLKRLTKMTPDLIILDMSMPGMGGMGFLKEISSPEGQPEHPVMVLTARANLAEFFADVDVDGFVTKPCDPDDLLKEMARIILLRKGGASQTGREGHPEKMTVLIGEDDNLVSENLISAFTDAGFIVDSALKGPEVLEKAIVQKPDVLVIKLVFANMNGDAVAGMLQQMPHTKGIPIVLYDDSGSQAPESKYTEAGVGIKQFVRNNNSVTLLAAVNKIVGS